MGWAWKLGDTITCYEIDHDGEGERGREVKIPGVPNAGSQCAEHACEHFDDIEIHAGGFTDSDFDDQSRVIEVVGVYDQPTRYRVRCQVKREYVAERL